MQVITCTFSQLSANVPFRDHWESLAASNDLLWRGIKGEGKAYPTQLAKHEDGGEE
jgi:hypothetical protein